ncbi:MAG: M13 family peptidase [Sphingobacteriales bacterium]|nr:MAG: M13 family peptidase [Sphingobacteriales bacterium]
MNKKFIYSGLALSMLFAACKSSDKKEESQPKEDILVANMDTTVNPADDFFDYAEGRWVKNTQIPKEESSWGIAHLVQEELYKRLLNINEEALKKASKTGVEQQIGDFWFSAMDTMAIERQGIASLKPELDKIDAIKDTKALMGLAAELHTTGLGVFFGEGASQDAKASDVMAYYMNQGGIGLPNRDYYFNTDERTTKIRSEYPNYIARTFVLMGADSTVAKTKAANIVALETKLAKSSRKLEALRDPYANYNKMAISQLKGMSPHIEWPELLNIMGVKHVDSVIVGQPEFFKALDNVIATENLQTLKDYMAFHLVRSNANYLSNNFADNNFNFFGKTLRGAEAQRPRWKRALDVEGNVIGEAVGKLFAKEYFNEKAKKRYEDMVENVRDAYKERIEKLDWMSDSTKKKALAKLKSITKKVGYPDNWKDFSSLHIDRSAYVQNILRANKWWNDYYMNKLGKPVDRTEWDMTPQTYNAYYNPSNNEIVLPAGIFTVPGYRDEQLDDALVYGYAAASTIGHEITHGFDDEGRQFDEKGNLKNWWSKEDEEQFNKRADVLVKQFNNMMPVDTQRINGKATLGENLADLGGILIALDAFKKTDTYKKGEKLNGLTPLQRYFLGYSLGWMYQIRKEQLASQLLTDVHSPAKYRVNGPFPNVPEFYEAFGVKPGNKMYIPDSLRVRLW